MWSSECTFLDWSWGHVISHVLLIPRSMYRRGTAWACLTPTGSAKAPGHQTVGHHRWMFGVLKLSPGAHSLELMGRVKALRALVLKHVSLDAPQNDRTPVRSETPNSGVATKDENLCPTVSIQHSFIIYYSRSGRQISRLFPRPLAPTPFFHDFPDPPE